MGMSLDYPGGLGRHRCSLQTLTLVSHHQPLFKTSHHAAKPCPHILHQNTSPSPLNPNPKTNAKTTHHAPHQTNSHLRPGRLVPLLVLESRHHPPRLDPAQPLLRHNPPPLQPHPPPLGVPSSTLLDDITAVSTAITGCDGAGGGGGACGDPEPARGGGRVCGGVGGGLCGEKDGAGGSRRRSRGGRHCIDTLVG